MPGVVVSDTSCLILFNNIGELNLLKKLYGKLSITEAIKKEYKRPLPEWIEINEPDFALVSSLSNYLDIGEASAIALAAKHINSVLIIDEAKGRKVAKQLGINITGSLGVILIAKMQGHVESVKPILDKIQDTNFRISKELIEKVIEIANES